MWPLRLSSRLAALLALTPAFAVFCVVYVGATGWTIWISFTGSRMLPSSVFVGLRQYEQLYANERWLVSVHNLIIFGVLFVAVSIALGFVLAVAIDQRVRAESLLRSVYLYPFSMSFVVTGLVWQWLLNPTVGLQSLFGGAGFAWLSNPRLAIYAVALAGAWQSAGLVMVIVLAALKGIDPEIRRAAALDAIPVWRTYVSLLLPQVRGALIAATLLLAMAAARVYDLVVAMTNGGPGNATELPAKFVMAYLFVRQNVGLASAAATMLLLTVAVLLAAAWAARRAMGR